MESFEESESAAEIGKLIGELEKSQAAAPPSLSDECSQQAEGACR